MLKRIAKYFYQWKTKIRALIKDVAWELVVLSIAHTIVVYLSH
ncbi:MULTISPECIES: hypothetical protein [unclassified Enterococcus]|nr:MULTISPECIES: hypothetical protein [unclassified Enterococcus]